MGYQGRKVVVTGADGFIGSHLVEALVAAGAEVTALALYNAFDTTAGSTTFPPEHVKASASRVATCATRISSSVSSRGRRFACISPR